MGTKVAVIQKPPVLLDRAKTIARAVESMDEADRQGATLLVFPEAYIPGYPTWIWRLNPGGDMGLSNEIHARLRSNAVDLSGNDLKPMQEAARKLTVTVVVGLHEIDSAFSGTTLVQHGRGDRRGWQHPQPTSQTHADQPGAHGLGHGRCDRA